MIVELTDTIDTDSLDEIFTLELRFTTHFLNWDKALIWDNLAKLLFYCIGLY